MSQIMSLEDRTLNFWKLSKAWYRRESYCTVAKAISITNDIINQSNPSSSIYARTILLGEEIIENNVSPVPASVG